MLLLGEANFSFALALRSLLEPPAASPGEKTEEQKTRELAYKDRLAVASGYLHLPPQQQIKITASCYEAPEELSEKYPESVGILSRLRSLGVEIRYQVNAWDLASTFGDETWDVIAWNHPHLGTEERLPKWSKTPSGGF